MYPWCVKVTRGYLWLLVSVVAECGKERVPAGFLKLVHLRVGGRRLHMHVWVGWQDCKGSTSIYYSACENAGGSESNSSGQCILFACTNASERLSSLNAYIYAIFAYRSNMFFFNRLLYTTFGTPGLQI